MGDAFINSEFTVGSVQGLPFFLGIPCILLFYKTSCKCYETYLGAAKLDLTKFNEPCTFVQSLATALQCFGVCLKKSLGSLRWVGKQQLSSVGLLGFGWFESFCPQRV